MPYEFKNDVNEKIICYAPPPRKILDLRLHNSAKQSANVGQEELSLEQGKRQRIDSNIGLRIESLYTSRYYRAHTDASA